MTVNPLYPCGKPKRHNQVKEQGEKGTPIQDISLERNYDDV